MSYCAEGFASADATRGQWKQTNVCGRPLDPFAVASHVTWFLSLQGRQKGKQYYRQYRTNELVRWRMHFLSDAIAEIEGLLEVNRDFCKKQMAEKASPALPTNCAVLPILPVTPLLPHPPRHTPPPHPCSHSPAVLSETSTARDDPAPDYTPIESAVRRNPPAPSA